MPKGGVTVVKGTLGPDARVIETTWHRWKNSYGGRKGPDVKRLKELKAERRKFKIVVAELSVDRAAGKAKALGRRLALKPRAHSAVELLRRRLGVSETCACKVTG